jgi:hypothetical protein
LLRRPVSRSRSSVPRRGLLPPSLCCGVHTSLRTGKLTRHPLATRANACSVVTAFVIPSAYALKRSCGGARSSIRCVPARLSGALRLPAMTYINRPQQWRGMTHFTRMRECCTRAAADPAVFLPFLLDLASVCAAQFLLVPTFVRVASQCLRAAGMHLLWRRWRLLVFRGNSSIRSGATMPF